MRRCLRPLGDVKLPPNLCSSLTLIAGGGEPASPTVEAPLSHSIGTPLKTNRLTLTVSPSRTLVTNLRSPPSSTVPW